jgi:protein-disulfide isomerase
MRQLVYITMILSSFCFAAEPVKDKKIITKEQLKIIEQKKQAMLKVAQKAAFETQPEFIYEGYLKSEVMAPNLEPVKNRVYGNKTARNKLVVFADFACGHCKDSSKELKLRVNENKQLVNLTYVFYPLDKACNKVLKGKLSDYSCVSAKLALCSEKEGKVWKAIDYLYAHQDDSRKLPFDTKKFIGDMGKKLNLKGLDACYSSKWVEDKLNEETIVHKGLKIPGTPIVLLNSRRLGGTYKSKEVFSKFIKFLDLKEHAQRK